MMSEFEKAEIIRSRANVSFEEARDALKACGGDLLDAMVYLERMGYYKTPKRNNSKAPENREYRNDSGYSNRNSGDSYLSFEEYMNSRMNRNRDRNYDRNYDWNYDRDSYRNERGNDRYSDRYNGQYGPSYDRSYRRNYSENYRREYEKAYDEYRNNGQTSGCGFWEFIKTMLEKSVQNFLVVTHRGEEKFRIPILAFVIILLMFNFGALIAMGISLFFGVNYSFVGKDDLSKVNAAMSDVGSRAAQWWEHRNLSPEMNDLCRKYDNMDMSMFAAKNRENEAKAEEAETKESEAKAEEAETKESEAKAEESEAKTEDTDSKDASDDTDHKDA